jgi:hypothetical protein
VKLSHLIQPIIVKKVRTVTVYESTSEKSLVNVRICSNREGHEQRKSVGPAVGEVLHLNLLVWCRLALTPE